MAKISVVIVDEQEIVRLGIRAALGNHEQITVLGEGMQEVDALRLASEYWPDVIILGLNAPADQRPSKSILPICDTIRVLVQSGHISVLILSRYAHKGLVRAVLRAGASGFVLREEVMSSSAILARAVIEIAQKGTLPLSLGLYGKLHLFNAELQELPQLTQRRITIMQTIADNPHLTIAQVADLLGIAESTLRNNLSAITRALDTPSVNGALIECLRLGLVQL